MKNDSGWHGLTINDGVLQWSYHVVCFTTRNGGFAIVWMEVWYMVWLTILKWYRFWSLGTDIGIMISPEFENDRDPILTEMGTEPAVFVLE